MKLGKKDRQILYQLDLNARQANSKIAKKVNLSKDAVGYRVKQLEKKGIIRGYNTIIDSSRLGYILYRCFFNLIDINPKKLNELIDFLKKEKNIWWIAKLDGAWNFIFAIWVKNNIEFRDFYNKLCLKFRENIKDKLICPLTAYKHLSRSYLLGTEKELKVETVAGGEKQKFDEIDIKILRFLSRNARTQLLEIAKSLKLDSMTIHHRIKRLEEKEIIQGYKADLDFTILKRDFYSVKINVKDITRLKELENHAKTIPELINIIEAIGSFDFEFDLEVENSERYFEIIDDLENKFDFIREVIYFRVLKNYKILYMPEI